MLQIYFKGGIRTKFHSMPLLLSHILSSYVKYQLFKPPLKSRHLVTGFNYGQKRVFTQTCLLKMTLIIKHFQKGPTVYRSHGPIFFYFYCYLITVVCPVSYTHLTLPTKIVACRSRWSPYH